MYLFASTGRSHSLAFLPEIDMGKQSNVGPKIDAQIVDVRGGEKVGAGGEGHGSDGGFHADAIDGQTGSNVPSRQVRVQTRHDQPTTLRRVGKDKNERSWKIHGLRALGDSLRPKVKTRKLKEDKE